MLKGVYTAIVTPFNEAEEIDKDALARLIEEQIGSGVAGIVPCGTTGESPTLTHEENEDVINFVCEVVKKRCHVMAGTGSNSTQEAIEMTLEAEKSGADSSLQVVPYYNRPTQKGLYFHFKAIAEEVKIPVIIYNIQARTGVNLETSTLAELSKIKNIIGVKEASGSIQQIMSVIKAVPKEFSVLSGDDNLTLPIMACGGHGVISVASNIIPRKIVELVNFGLKDDFISMRKLHYELDDFFSKQSIETNPIPIKMLLALKGKIKPVYRLPLVKPEDKNIEILKEILIKYGI